GLARAVRVRLGVQARLLGPLEGTPDLRLGLLASHPVVALVRLARLEVLVDLEEVLDLETVELADVLDVSASRRALVRGGLNHDLVVDARLVPHAEHAHRATADETAEERRLLEEDEGVERVAVLAEGVLDEGVVVGVAGGGVEHPVQADPSRLVI